MVKKTKTDVDRLLLILKIEESSISAKFIGHFFLHCQNQKKYIYVRVYFLHHFSNFKNECLFFFGCKHVKTEQTFLHELTCFVNYHMPLRGFTFMKLLNFKDLKGVNPL